MVNIDLGVDKVADGVAKIIGLFKTNPALAAELTDKDSQRQLERDIQQVLLNIKEAGMDLWRGGWRPAVGWTCASAFFYNFVLQPFLVFAFTMAGFGTEVAQLPDLNMYEVMGVLVGMLGISHHRSGDKRAGVHRT